MTPHAYSSFLFYAEQGSVSHLHPLLQAHPEWAQPKECTTTALHLAAARGHVDCVKVLLPYSDAHAVDEEGEDALMQAAKIGSAPCVECLLPVSDAKRQHREGKETALHYASRRGSAACVSLLIPRSDPDAQTAQELTPLMTAVINGHMSCVNLLIPVSDVLKRTSPGVDVLEMAWNGHLWAFVDALVPFSATPFLHARLALDSVIARNVDLLPQCKALVERAALETALEDAGSASLSPSAARRAVGKPGRRL